MNADLRFTAEVLFAITALSFIYSFLICMIGSSLKDFLFLFLCIYLIFSCFGICAFILGNTQV